MLRRRSAAKGHDGKGSAGESSGSKADGKEHLHFDCKKCGTANDVAVVRPHAGCYFCWSPTLQLLELSYVLLPMCRELRLCSQCNSAACREASVCHGQLVHVLWLVAWPVVVPNCAPHMCAHQKHR